MTAWSSWGTSPTDTDTDTDTNTKPQQNLSDAALRRRVIERTLTIIEAQVAADHTGTEALWGTAGAWQMWAEQVDRLERALTPTERAAYGQRLEALKARLRLRYDGAPRGGQQTAITPDQLIALEQQQAAALRALGELRAMAASERPAPLSAWALILALTALVLLILLMVLK